MALLSSVALIRSLALFHLTLAYYFLVAPQTIASQSVVFLMGEAMQLVGLPHLLGLLPWCSPRNLFFVITFLPTQGVFSFFQHFL